MTPLIPLLLLFGCGCALAELPNIPDKLGEFVSYEDRKAHFNIGTDGKIEMRPMRTRKQADNDYFRIEVVVETRPKGETGKWTRRRVDEDQLKAASEAACDPREAARFSARVTTGIVYQVRVEKTRKGMLVNAWLSDLGERSEDLDIRLRLGVQVPNFFSRVRAGKSGNRAEKLEAAMRKSELRVVNAKMRALSFDFGESLDLAEAGLDQGFVALELRCDRMERLRRLLVTTTEPREPLLKFVDFQKGRFDKGFEFGVEAAMNQLGSKADPGLVFTMK